MEEANIQEEIIDFTDESEGDEEVIEQEDNDSESEQSLEEDSEVLQSPFEDDYHFFIGKDGFTLWMNIPVQKSSKTRAKHIIKILPGPTRAGRNAKTELESFLKFITFDMIDEIVRYTNIYIEKKDQMSNMHELETAKILLVLK